jgi:glutamate synthase (NADPH/NADH) large chain
VVETAEAREVHHFALLIGYGAAAVNPWLALDTVRSSSRWGCRGELASRSNYVHAVNEGLLKVMSKMGISTVQSYRGAQIFEAWAEPRADRPSLHGHAVAAGGRGLDELGARCASATRAASPSATTLAGSGADGGVYQWRRRGELHKWNPGTIAKLQAATRANDAALFAEVLPRWPTTRPRAPRCCAACSTSTTAGPAVPLDEVERQRRSSSASSPAR